MNPGRPGKLLISGSLISINEEYLVDVRGTLILLCVIGLFRFCNNDKPQYNRTALLLCLGTIILMLPIGLSFGHVNALQKFTQLNIILKNIFEFWT